MAKKFKGIIFILCYITLNYTAFAQSNSQQYQTLTKKADNLYRTKNYKSSAQTYSLAFKVVKWNVPINDRYNAACVWTLANNPDSAFSHLNHLAITDNYTDYKQISTDHDLSSLHKDKRWKELLNNIQKNIDRKEAKLDKPLIKLLDSIYDEDQQYRQQLKRIEEKYGRSSLEIKNQWKVIHEKDSANRIKILSILESRGWLGKDVIGEKGNATLFLVIQHADIQTQEKYLPLMKDAVKKGNAYASDLALLEDRIALKNGKKQIYGSQIIRDSITNKNMIAPIEDEINVDKRRAEVGLEPLEEYVKNWDIVYTSKSSPQSIKVKLPTNNMYPITEIKDSIVSSLNVVRGNGRKFTFRYYGNDVEEENVIWLKFTCNYDTLLTFDIVPDDLKNDYDFAIYKCSDDDCISQIHGKKIKPERYCLSANEAKKGSTGLSEYETAKFVGPGLGNGYVAALNVKAGETYFLMINYAEQYWNIYHMVPKGFTIYFYNYWPKKRKLEATNQILSEDRAKTVANYLISKKVNKDRIQFKGMGSKQPIASNDSEEGREKNRRVEFVIH